MMRPFLKYFVSFSAFFFLSLGIFPTSALALGTCTAALRGIASFACPGTPTQDVCGIAPNYSCYVNAGEPVCGANQAFDCNTCSCTCGAGFTNCGGTCVANLQCPAGLTANTCAQTCTTPYVLLAPPAPQSGGVNVIGDIHSTGGDLYLGNGKSVRVDGGGATSLYFGNWGVGASGFDLNVQGNFYASRYIGDLFLDDGATIRLDNKYAPTTLNITNGDGAGVFLNVGGAVAADTIDVNQAITASTFCIGASCISAWPSGGGGNGTITAVTAGTGLTGGGNTGAIQLAADTTYFNTQYINASGNDIMSGSLTANGLLSTTGAAFGGYGLDATWKISAPNAYLGNGVSGTIIGAGSGQNAGDITTDGVLFAKTSLHAPTVTGDTQLCIGASCISAWPSGGGGNGTITAVTAGTGLTGGGNTGAIQLAADTTYFNTQYINASGNDIMSGSLTANGLLSTTGAAFGGYGLDATWKISVPNAYLGNGVSGTIIGAGSGQNAGDITTDGVLFAKTSLHAPTVTGDTQLCIGATCKNAWPLQGILQETDTFDTVMQRGNQTAVGDLVLGVGASNVSLTLGDIADLRWINFGKNSNVGFYNSPTQFDVEQTVYFQGGLDVPSGVLSASVPIQVSGADVEVQGGKVLSTGAGSGICTDAQGLGNCTGANAPSAGAVKATKLCLPGVAPFGGCINDWTVGGGGDITDVIAGNGLTTGGATGAVTLHVGAGQGIVVAADTVALDSTYTDSLYVKKTGDFMSGKLSITNPSQAPGSYGIDVSGSAGAGLFSNPTTGASAQLGSGAFGVIGYSGGSAGTGIYGSTGSGVGVSGYAGGGGFGVQGYASSTGNGIGVYGEGDKYGVWGQSLHQNGYAVYASGRLYASGAATLNGGLTLGGVSRQQWPAWEASISGTAASTWKTFSCNSVLSTLVSYTCYYGAGVGTTACPTSRSGVAAYQLSVYIPSGVTAVVTLNCQL